MSVCRQSKAVFLDSPNFAQVLTTDPVRGSPERAKLAIPLQLNALDS